MSLSKWFTSCIRNGKKKDFFLSGLKFINQYGESASLNIQNEFQNIVCSALVFK